MKKNSRYLKIVFSSIIVLLIAFSIMNINASSKNIKACLYGDKIEVTPGQEYKVTLKISEIKNVEKGMYAYRARIVYDKEIFENLIQDSFQTLSDWESLKFNENSSEFVAINKTGFKKDEEIVQITLKLKDNIEPTNTKIEITDIVASEGKNDIYIDNENILVNVISNNHVKPTVPNGSSNSVIYTNNSSKDINFIEESSPIFEKNEVGEEENIITNNESIDSENNREEVPIEYDTEKKSEINKDYFILFIIILINIIVVIYYIIKNLKNGNDDDTKKKNVSKAFMIVISSFLCLQIISSVEAAFYDFSKKGEVNGDKKIDYEDVNLLEFHLINKKLLDNIYLENADMNNDGFITVTDLAILVQKLENKLDYEVSLEEVKQEKEFVNKDEEFFLKFRATASYDAKIKKVKVDNKYYDVILDNKEEGIYKIKLNSSRCAGIKEYKFSEIILNNDKTIKIDFTEAVKVLKAKPVIENYNIIDDFINSKVVISFNLLDADKSFTSGEIKILDELGNLVKEFIIKEGNNDFTTTLENNKIYNAKFIINYNLVSKDDLAANQYNNKFQINKELQIIENYKFNIGNYKIYNEISEPNIFYKNENVTISFESSNTTKYFPDLLKVNGKNYKVYKKDNIFFTEIPGLNKLGKNDIILENVTLNNGKQFNINKKFTINIIKKAPKVSNFMLEENANGEIDINFNLTNEDNALTNMIINVSDENDILIKQIKFNFNEINGSKNIRKKIYGLPIRIKYKISVVASYSQTGESDDIKSNVILYENDYIAQFKAEILEILSDKNYYEKGDKATLVYKIKTNCPHNINKLRINNKDFLAIKVGNDLYQVNYNIPESSGIYDLFTTKVVCSNGNVASVSGNIKIEVLKDELVIENYLEKYSTSKSKVNISFLLKDNDSSLINGKIILVTKNGDIVFNRPVTKGKNSFDLDLKPFTNYILKINVTYDRDSLKDEINRINKNLIVKEIEGSKEYNLEISNIKTNNGKKETKYFNKNEKINLEFESKNTRNIDIVEATINGKNYLVNKASNSYKILVDGYLTAGEKTLAIEKVKLANLEVLTIKDNNKKKVEVLKDVPTVSNCTQNINSSKVVIDFNLNDSDNSLINAKAIFLDSDGKIISKKDIVKGKNTIEYVIKKSTLYTLKINVTYDRDSMNDSFNKVEDKTIFTKEIIDSTGYNVTIINFKTLKNNQESKYFVRNEKIDVVFNSTNTSNLDIIEVTINNKKYLVNKSENHYQVKLDGYKDSGEKTLVIEKVKLSNNIEIEVSKNNELQLEILKSKPSISNYKVIEDINESKLNILFDLVDNDNSLIEGNLKVTDYNGKVIKDVKIKKGANSFNINVLEGKDYKVKFELQYNLSLDDKATDKNIIGKITHEKTLRLDINYNFVANNFKLYNDKNEEASIFGKKQDIKLVFESTNSTKHIPNKININNKEYDVVLENNKYSVIISGFESFGSKKLSINKITLSNGKDFEIKNDIDVKIVKNVPSVTDLSVVDKGERVRVDFTINDEDKALKDVLIVLMDENDNIVEQEHLTKDEILEAGNFTKLYNGVYTSKYKVKIISGYLLTENENEIQNNVVLALKEIDSTAKVNNLNVTSDKRYYEKGSDIILTYNLETNKADDIISFTINNKEYPAIKQSDGSYQVKIKAATSAGVKSLKTTNISFGSDQIVRVDKTLKIEVLKDILTVTNFKQIDNINDSKVTLKFEINDSDNSFISGEASLINRKDGNKVSKSIIKGENSLEFNVVELDMYDFSIKATYDRDSNSLESIENENVITDEVLLNHEVQLVVDYDLSVNNINTYKNNLISKYFLKNEEITLQFESSNITSFEVSEVTINGKKYNVNKNNDIYQVKLSGYSTSGVKNIVIDKIKLSNTKEFNITKNNEVQIEILKSIPSIKNFAYEEKVSGDVSVKFNVVDSEEAMTSGKVLILEDNTNLEEQQLKIGDNTITFTPKSEKNYIVKIIGNYDLDTNVLDNSSNKYENVVLLENEINLGSRKLQIKDIVSSIVYKKTDEGVKEASDFNVADLNNLDNFIVKVKTKDMPTFYTTIEEYRIDNNRLKLTLKYDDVVQYNGSNKQNKLEIDYGKVNNGIVQNTSLELLIKKMEANPSGTFELTQDYDATFVGSAITAVNEKFTGTLNGNGHTISNLGKPLFKELEGATIKNLVFTNVSLSGANSHGTIANIATDTTVTNVHIKGLNYTTGADHSAGMIGEATNTNIEKSSVTNFVITTSGHVRVAAIIGKLTNGSIKNCYVEGSINSTQTKDANGIGGVLGHGYGIETIENCITKIAISNNQGPRLNGGVVGLFMNQSSILKNNVSLSSGQNFYSVYGNGNKATATNNYELKDSGLTTNANASKYIVVSQDDIKGNFYKDTAKFDEDIWDLSNVSYDKLPLLKNDDPNGTLEVSEKGNIYLPDYDRLKKITGFKKSKEILYHNIYKLMPYYDAKYLIEDATKIASDNVLATKTIKHVLPYSNGKLLTYFTSENYNTITDIKVVFDDLKISRYKVNFKELNQNISIYEIEELGLDYAPSNYVIKNDAEIVNTLKAYIEGLDYTTVLDPLTAAADARHYKDYYNETTKTLALDIALQLLQNDEDNSLTINNDILNTIIKEQLIDTRRLNKILYAYNYYHKWYHFEIGGTKVSDILLFENKMFKDNNNFDNLINEVFVGNIGVGVTDTFFRNNIGKYTGSSELRYFLDYIITNIGEYSDVDDWFTEYFGARNILSEFGVDKNPDILYRGWYQLKKNGRMILPVITLPENCAYIISGPAHLQIGPSQLYHKDVNTAAGRAAVQKKVNDHSNLVKRHLSTLAGSFDPGKWNNYCIMVYDCTRIITGYKNSYFPGTNVVMGTSPVYTQGKVGQNYPFFKNFSEVLGLWQPSGSAAGVGNTAGFLWFIARPGLTNYDTWTHEFEHALFDKIMLFQAGTRFKAGLETLTEGNVQQNGVWSENNLTQDVGPYYFNTSFDLNKEGNATQNLSPDRIDTREKLENYFRGQQNALDLLDYIEGKAFIRLTPEQQARVATRMNQSGGWSTWGAITAAQAEQMKLTSLESLYDNRIIIRPENAWGVSVRGLKVINSLGTNDYGFESIWVNRWYIGHNDNGIPDAFSAKRNYFEMLGYAGVDGYVTYGRGNTKTDLDAIQKVTKAVTGTAMNWKEYKMSRYATVEENIRNNKYIDVDYMIERFYQALLSDTNRNATSRTNLRKIYYHYLKSVTNDFVDDPLGTTVEVNHIKTAEELVEKINAQPYGYYVLDNDIDFSHMTTNVTQTFMGRLDGNGHKIIGNTLPIFNKIRYGYVGNIHFENTNIPKTISNAGALSYKSEMSTVEKINVTNLKMNFGGRNDLSLIGGAVSNVVTRDCTVEKFAYHIRSAEDMAKLNEDTGGIFVIDNDIDFAGKNYNGTVISNIFTGKIDGQGHTLSNLTDASLFANFRGTVENLKIKNFSNTSSGRGNGDYVTAFTQESFTATFRNLRFENITLSGRNNVAVVSGADARDNANSVFENISVKNANVTGTGVYVSTFIGRKYGGRISNVFVQGKLTINSTENGGLVGSLQQNGTVVENVVTDVSITKTHNTYGNVSLAEINGSMFGNIYNTPVIRNSIAFGSMTGYTNTAGVELKPYKFVGASEDQIIATMTKCFEVDEEIGSTRVSENTTGKLNSVARANLNKQFYKNLGFDEAIWNLDNLSVKGYPTFY